MKSRGHGSWRAGETSGVETRRRKSQLGHRAGARFDFPQTILSPDDAPGKEARRHCCRPRPAGSRLASPATRNTLRRTQQRSVPTARTQQESTSSPSETQRTRGGYHSLRTIASPRISQNTTGFHPSLRSTWYPCSVKHYLVVKDLSRHPRGLLGGIFQANLPECTLPHVSHTSTAHESQLVGKMQDKLAERGGFEPPIEVLAPITV
jgi:hypothetical protein